MKNHRKSGIEVLFVLCMMSVLLFPEKSEAGSNFSGDWVKEGGSWYFFLGPNEPLENEWLDYNGESYYIGSGGKMATGRFVDPEDKTEYFFDTDGRLLEDEFSKSGELYIGKGGKELRYFNEYRSFIRKELEKLKGKDFGKKREKDSGEKNAKTEEEAIHPAAFALLDINEDGYKDIILLQDKVGEETKLSPTILSVILYQEQIAAQKGSNGKSESESLPVKQRTLLPLLEEEANGEYSTVIRKNKLSGEPSFLRTNGAEDFSLFVYKKDEGLTQLYSLVAKRDRMGSAEYYSFSDKVSFQDYQSVFLTIQNQFAEPYSLKVFNLDEEGLTTALKDFSKEELSFYASQEFNQ